MEMPNPKSPRNKEKIMEYTTVPQTVGNPSGFKNHPSVLFSVVSGLLAIFFVIVLLFTLWFWNKRKKQQVSYFRVTVVPLVTLSQSRERAKNIYGFLPQSQARPGRCHSRNIRIFSTESLIPCNLDNPNSEHVFSPTVHVLQSHRTSVPTIGYAVGIYDNTALSQVCENLVPAVDYVNVGASIESMSTSSEDSQDYVNVPNAEEVSRNPSIMNSLSGNLQDPQTSEEGELSAERDSSSRDAEDCTSIWVLGLEDSDYHGDAEGSSQSSDDYVNVPAADNEEDQGRQHWVTFQDCRAYDNVLWAEPNRKKLYTGGGLTSTNIGGILGWTPSLPSDVQCEEPRENSLDFWGYENIEPLSQDENSQETTGEMDSEESNDYINVPALVEEGKLNIEHETEERILTTEQKPTNQDGDFCTCKGFFLINMGAKVERGCLLVVTKAQIPHTKTARAFPFREVTENTEEETNSAAIPGACVLHSGKC
ncbi:lymphocyte transmembrane adapter 1 [Dromiciops gliroides]|uniref:lymphocyte transmembrane adapter 1 n=1 Tax=Dromiciops gliroides TaxID=33562 RepID=UPI001CC638CE|nr:lymphocyte transmembrane adapter 1 [Dromiciops gliroides]